MALRLYFDECVDARIVASTRRRSIDSASAADEGLLGASDDELLQRATLLGPVVVSADEDFFRLVDTRHELGLSSPGLNFVPSGTAVGCAVRGLEIGCTVFEPAEMVDQIDWVR